MRIQLETVYLIEQRINPSESGLEARGVNRETLESVGSYSRMVDIMRLWAVKVALW